MQVVGGSVDGTVRQFDIRMGMMFTDTLHESVTGIAVSHDSNCILASCLDNSVKLLDKASGELLATYTGEHTLGGHAKVHLTHLLQLTTFAVSRL